jgi:hypothetical protein
LGFTVILLELCGSHLLRVEVADASPTCFQNPTAASGAAEQETIVDKTPDELVRALPELAGLEPAQGQEILPVVLKKVGENVEAYFRNFLSTTALEETVQQRLRLDGNVEETFRQEYRYLVVTHPGNGPMDWDEYRADKEGRPVGTTAQGGALLTARFFYVPIYLHSQYQEDSDFSYLGQQNVDGHKCHVIAFAQSPDTARLKVTLTEGLVSYKVFLQGLAWIDATSYQIIRMYTELLPDLSVRAIKKQTTEVTFGEVHFKRIDVSFWLPREVVVNTDWSGRKFRNYHRYSGYQLYSSETKLIY